MKALQSVPVEGSKSPATKKKVGRPKAQVDLAKAERLAAQGLTQEEVAHCLGISPSTLYEIKREFPEFTEALKRGKAMGVAEISNVIYSAAHEGSVPAAMFYLRSRAGWRDKGVFIPEVLQDILENDVGALMREFAAELLQLPQGALNRSGKYPHIAAQVFDFAEEPKVSKIPDTP